MYSYPCQLPGVIQLGGVGYGGYNMGVADSTSITSYKTMSFPLFVKSLYNRCISVIIASLTTGQTDAMPFLKRQGFEQVAGPVRNPNSGNDILLFAKFLPVKRKPTKKKVIKKKVVKKKRSVRS